MQWFCLMVRHSLDSESVQALKTSCRRKRSFVYVLVILDINVPLIEHWPIYGHIPLVLCAPILHKGKNQTWIQNCQLSLYFWNPICMAPGIILPDFVNFVLDGMIWSSMAWKRSGSMIMYCFLIASITGAILNLWF